MNSNATTQNAVNNNATTTEPSQNSSNNDSSFDENLALLSGWLMFVGLLGVLANTVVLCALLSKKLRDKTNSRLILNQVLLDLYSSVLLIITFAVQLTVTDFSQPWGNAVCKLFFGQFLLYVGVHASITSLVFITLERYFKIVLSVYHRRFFKKWMIWAAMVICLLIGVLNTFSPLINHEVEDGQCNYVLGPFSPDAATTYSILLVVWHYFVPILIFIYCYTHILVCVRRTAKVAHTAMPSEEQRIPKTQMNIIKTMIFVSLVFLLCWLLNNTVYLISIVNINETFLNNDWTYLANVAGFLNMCVNPFVYATNLNNVKKQIQTMICPKRFKPPPPLHTGDSTVASRPAVSTEVRKSGQ